MYSYTLSGKELFSPSELFARIRGRQRGTNYFEYQGDNELYKGKLYLSIFIKKISLPKKLKRLTILKN